MLHACCIFGEILKQVGGLLMILISDNNFYFLLLLYFFFQLISPQFNLSLSVSESQDSQQVTESDLDVGFLF